MAKNKLMNDYIKPEEAALFYAIKKREKITFSEMAKQMDVGLPFFSKVLHGRRTIPSKMRKQINELKEKYKDLPIEEAGYKADIPQYIIIENNNTGDQLLYRISDEVFFETIYRRSTEENRDSILKSLYALPDDYHYVASGERVVDKITSDEYMKIILLKTKYKVTLLNLSKMVGSPSLTSWSAVVNKEKAIPKEQREALHKVFKEYGLE